TFDAWVPRTWYIRFVEGAKDNNVAAVEVASFSRTSQFWGQQGAGHGRCPFIVNAPFRICSLRVCPLACAMTTGLEAWYPVLAPLNMGVIHHRCLLMPEA
ncbi:unnamed protein product, partial [Ectocarpus fasciculatus]